LHRDPRQPEKQVILGMGTKPLETVCGAAFHPLGFGWLSQVVGTRSPMWRAPLLHSMVSYDGVEGALLLTGLVLGGAFLLPFAMVWLEPRSGSESQPRHRAERRPAESEYRLG
jgi:hypothetical protein